MLTDQSTVTRAPFHSMSLAASFKPRITEAPYGIYRLHQGCQFKWVMKSTNKVRNGYYYPVEVMSRWKSLDSS